MTTTLPGWLDVWWRIAAICLAISGCIGGWFMLSPSSTGAGADLAVALLVYIVVLIGSCVPLAVVVATPLSRLRRQLAAGSAALDLDRVDVVAALRLPLRVFFTMFSIGVVLDLALIAASFTVPALTPWRLTLGVGGAATALLSATAHGYTQHRLIVTRATPLLLPHGRLDHLGVVPTLRVWHHLVLFGTNLIVCWPAILLAVVADDIDDNAVSALPLLVLYIGLNVLQVVSILGVVSRNVGHLRERLEEVRDGNLDTRATVFAFDSFGVVMSEFNKMVEGLRQREQLKETFGRYVTRQIADEILAGRVELGGELRTATVLFSDIRGFTSMSEQLAPAEVVAFLNEYLTAMVDCVIEHGGVLDKFIGDAVLAVFGVPVGTGSVAGDARAAIACAVAMGQRLDEMNARRRERGQPAIAIGIGVHTGELVAGNIGSPKRMQYTVIGDTVNVGSRLESLTKEHRRRILLSAATAALLGDSVALEEVGTVAVRGRREPLLIFGLADGGQLP